MTVRRLTPTMEKLCNGHGKQGTGGMHSKLRAAKVASEVWVHLAIVNERDPRAIVGGVERKIGSSANHRLTGGLRPAASHCKTRTWNQRRTERDMPAKLIAQGRNNLRPGVAPQVETNFIIVTFEIPYHEFHDYCPSGVFTLEPTIT